MPRRVVMSFAALWFSPRGPMPVAKLREPHILGLLCHILKNRCARLSAHTTELRWMKPARECEILGRPCANLQCSNHIANRVHPIAGSRSTSTNRLRDGKTAALERGTQCERTGDASPQGVSCFTAN